MRTKERIKICGVTSVNDAKMVSKFPIDFIGLNFVKRSKRRINLNLAKKIVKVLRKEIKPVLIFENENINNVFKTARLLRVSYIQLHGIETPEYCRKLKGKNLKIIKALPARRSVACYAPATYETVCDYLLIDSQNKKNQLGGTGKKADWKIARKIVLKSKIPVFLAGGLNPNNIKDAIKQVKPYGIDVNSGVETHVGKKDRKKIEKLFNVGAR